jgi:hypothetical protein
MLVGLSVVEQRYHAAMEVISGGAPVVEVAERYGVSRSGSGSSKRIPRGIGYLPGIAARRERDLHNDSRDP